MQWTPIRVKGEYPSASGGPMNISVTTNEQDQAFVSNGAQATLEDKIKALIDNTFRRKADDLTKLQHKIDTLTKHLTNELDRTPIDDKAIKVLSQSTNSYSCDTVSTRSRIER